MKSKFLFVVVLLFCSISNAENPIVQTIFTADPAPMVYNDTFYVYSGHDDADANSGWFNMKEWRVYSSVDMANWTDHGSPMDLSAFSWANADAWAGQCIPRNGKFYFSVPVYHTGTKNRMIGIAVADKPTGPFKDAIGSPLLTKYDCCYIDPAFYIDDDDQAYMYWGNPNCYYVKMNKDMISYSGDIVQIPENAQTFSNCYGEAPWLYKRNSLYYLLWAADNSTGKENIRYSTSNSPTGPWAYKGVIMNTEGVNWVKPCTSWTNHEGIIDYKGSSYFVYHNAGLPNSGTKGFTRSVCIEKFTFNADGTIPLIHMTLAGPPQIGNLNPYDTTQAETICWAWDVKTEKCSEGGMDVTKIENGDYIKVKGVDFGEGGAKQFTARMASGSSGGSIEIRLDTISGPLVGTCATASTGGWQSWATKTCTISGAKGVHNVYFKFTGGSGQLFNFNWWVFTPADPTGSAAEFKKATTGWQSCSITMSKENTITLNFGAEQSVVQKKVSIQLLDLSGKLKATLFTGNMAPSQQTLALDRTKIRPGAYVVRVSEGSSTLFSNQVLIN